MKRGSAVITNKYAEALIKIAKSQNRLDEQAEELKLIKDILASNERLMKVFKHPALPLRDKEPLLKKLLDNYSLSETTRHLLMLLLKKDRLALIEPIFLKYTKLVDLLQNRRQIDVISPIPLKKTQEERLIAKLTAFLQAEIRLNVKINPKILGGLVLQLGDKIIDGSVRRQLFILRRELMGHRRY